MKQSEENQVQLLLNSKKAKSVADWLKEDVIFEFIAFGYDIWLWKKGFPFVTFYKR